MEKEKNRKHIIKKAAVIFLVAMLLLTFFSNTIMNYSLPEVATEPVTTGTVSNKVRGQGTVETNSDCEVTVSGTRVVKEVKVEAGDEVKKGDVLFTFEEGENSELDEAQNALDDLELNYAKSLLKAAPDYTEDNIGIQDAKADLQSAIEAQEKASKNDKAVKTAKKEAEDAKKAVAAQQATVDSLQEKSDAYAAVGDYDTVSDSLKSDNDSLAAMKVQLSDLKEDLKKAQDNGEDTTDLNRQIRDKETEIANTQDKISTESKLLESLKPSKQTKTDLATATKKLAALQKTQEDKEAKYTELSSKTSTLEDAKTAVKEKRKALDALIRGLKTKKKEDALSAESDALDNEATQKSIEEQKEKVDKIKASNDVKEVKAEEDGIVSEVNCKEGDSVTPDAPLAKLQLSDSGYIVKVTVTKAQAKLIRSGDEATVENIWDDSVSATVKSIRADTENPNQSMIVTFEVKGDVSVGQTLAFSVGERSSQYDAVVPNNAVREDSKGKFVLILKVKGTPLGNRYTVKRADVEVQASDDTSSGVSGGVYENDNVITNSSKPLEEGMQVRLVE
ncbi:MAG: HlyD family efflux transporter periplasmic adaptor subunit [Lachnospiraceae bacterium]|nr:HlyD family efflux transporter periplasmic adaptor subunit [Lachnospiraceae bacterium]